jgi:outer membrane biosynthesis protein TonB
MKLTRIVRILSLISFLGGSALIYAQDQRDDAKPPQDPRPEATKPAGNEDNPPRQDEAKPPKQDDAKPPREEAKPANQEAPKQAERPEQRHPTLNRAAAFLTTSSGPTSDGSIPLSSSGQQSSKASPVSSTPVTGSPSSIHGLRAGLTQISATSTM